MVIALPKDAIHTRVCVGKLQKSGKTGGLTTVDLFKKMEGGQLDRPPSCTRLSCLAHSVS